MPATRIDWALSQLNDGDELGSQPNHLVPVPRNLASLYARPLGVPRAVNPIDTNSARLAARAIVEGNGIEFTDKAINDWIVRTGGRMQDNGVAVFTSGSKIRLPPGGPRQQAKGDPAPTPTTPAPSSSTKIPGAVVGAVAGALIGGVRGALVGAAAGQFFLDGIEV